MTARKENLKAPRKIQKSGDRKIREKQEWIGKSKTHLIDHMLIFSKETQNHTLKRFCGAWFIPQFLISTFPKKLFTESKFNNVMLMNNLKHLLK